MAKPVSPPLLLRSLLHQDDLGSPSSSPSSPLHSFSQLSLGSPSGSPFPGSPVWLGRELSSDERGLYLIHLLLNCATHVSSGNLDRATATLDQISPLVSPSGDAMQRVAAYFTEALAHRILRSYPGLYRAVRSSPPVSDSLLAARYLFDLCPLLKLSFLVSNQTIFDAFESERVVHVVDIGGIAASPDRPAHLLALLRALRARPGGPPHLRITAVCEHRELLERAAGILTEEAERLDIPFQFCPVNTKIEDLDLENSAIRVRTGETLAISSVLQLHRLLADETHPQKGLSSPFHHRLSSLGELLEKEHTPRFLSALERLSPKVVVVVEQESDHNGSGLGERFTEALNYYAAMFDCLESSAPRAGAERERVERVVWGEEIKSIIAGEGVERRERHERVEGWGRRMEMAGFGRVRVSGGGVEEARRMVVRDGRELGFGVREEGGCSFVCWQERALYSVSAWRSCRRFN